MVLEGLGHHVLAAESKAGLLAELDQLQPDIVVSDYRLSDGETGIDVVAAVRAHLGVALPALVITGDTDTVLERDVSDQCIVVMHKSLNLCNLQATLQELTGQAASSA